MQSTFRVQSRRAPRWEGALVPQLSRRRSILPLSRPPSQLVIRKSYGEVQGDVELSLDEFRRLIALIRAETSDADVSQQKPVDHASLTADRPELCVACGCSLFRKYTKRLVSACPSCGLRYVASKSVRIQDTPENAEKGEMLSHSVKPLPEKAQLRDFRNCSILVYLNQGPKQCQGFKETPLLHSFGGNRSVHSPSPREPSPNQYFEPHSPVEQAQLRVELHTLRGQSPERFYEPHSPVEQAQLRVEPHPLRGQSPERFYEPHSPVEQAQLRVELHTLRDLSPERFYKPHSPVEQAQLRVEPQPSETKSSERLLDSPFALEAIQKTSAVDYLREYCDNLLTSREYNPCSESCLCTELKERKVFERKCFDAEQALPIPVTKLVPVNKVPQSCAPRFDFMLPGVKNFSISNLSDLHTNISANAHPSCEIHGGISSRVDKAQNSLRRAELLVPPPNLYPGDAARRVLQTVEEVLAAMCAKKPVFVDRERQSVVTENALELRASRSKKDPELLKQKVMRNCTRLEQPQRAVGYMRVMGARFVDKCKFGKDNQIRRQILGRVINGCSRKTVGTAGSLPPGFAVLPSKVLRTLGDTCRRPPPLISSCVVGDTYPCSMIRSNATMAKMNETISGEGNAIRYPVIDKLNIAYAQLVSGGDRWTADVPSSQFRYNGGDNDGDAFNFERFTNGLLANSAYENRVCTAPAFNMCNNGEIKMEFDSDAKLGLGTESVSTVRRDVRLHSSKRISYESLKSLKSLKKLKTEKHKTQTHSIAYRGRTLLSGAHFLNKNTANVSRYGGCRSSIYTYTNIMKRGPGKHISTIGEQTDSNNRTESQLKEAELDGGVLKAGLIDDHFPCWKREMRRLRTSFFITGKSWKAYKRFLELEAFGRERSRFGAVFSLHDYAHSLPSGAMSRMIDTQAIPRLTLAHYVHSTRALGKQRFPYNSSPVTRQIASSLLCGLRAHEFAASCQATFDALADQKSSQMSLQGNLQYQFQYVMRPMVLAADRRTVFNPVTQRVVGANVSSLYAITRANADSKSLVKAALDFARIAIGMTPAFKRGREEANSLRNEAEQFARFAPVFGDVPKLHS